MELGPSVSLHNHEGPGEVGQGGLQQLAVLISGTIHHSSLDVRCIALKTFFEMGCTSYSGTPDLTLNNSQVSVAYSRCRTDPAPEAYS